MKMLGRTKRPQTCRYGARCCRGWHTPHSKKRHQVRSVKRREQRSWKSEAARR
jgi:hypothetical protein